VAITRAGRGGCPGTVPGVSERDVQTQLEYGFFAAGATGLAYGTIVGSGENAPCFTGRELPHAARATWCDRRGAEYGAMPPT